MVNAFTVDPWVTFYTVKLAADHPCPIPDSMIAKLSGLHPFCEKAKILSKHRRIILSKILCAAMLTSLQQGIYIASYEEGSDPPATSETYLPVPIIPKRPSGCGIQTKPTHSSLSAWR
ncbi:hypothetical protein ADUPG1_000956 [Aduncisulcus paluster]|uniref:Uncharacterized protein n=1 Tax=Aduncisulcus paluster TaxID=2918883 RepID=A0ABQ5K8R1_9EUKA|nr:hypothetical protein ADUPG1_000956 [Aduncisulcus paluster]